MTRRIIGFHQDAHLDWVADLECGHGQHIRHQPPWTTHPWVLTEEGRAQWVGATLECKECDPSVSRPVPLRDTIPVGKPV